MFYEKLLDLQKEISKLKNVIDEDQSKRLSVKGEVLASQIDKLRDDIDDLIEYTEEILVR